MQLSHKGHDIPVVKLFHNIELRLYFFPPLWIAPFSVGQSGDTCDLVFGVELDIFGIEIGKKVANKSVGPHGEVVDIGDELNRFAIFDREELFQRSKSIDNTSVIRAGDYDTDSFRGKFGASQSVSLRRQFKLRHQIPDIW